MAEKIKNLFKHEIPLHSRGRTIQKRNNYLQDFSMYRTVLIKDPPAMGIENSGDIYNKVNHFFVIWLVNMYQQSIKGIYMSIIALI